MMQTILLLIVWSLCAIVFVSSICRLKALQKGVNKLSWVGMYLLFGAFAIDTAFSARELLIEHETHTIIGLLALTFNVLATQHSWRSGAPSLSEISTKDAP